jgi:hypothetical protein
MAECIYLKMEIQKKPEVDANENIDAVIKKFMMGRKYEFIERAVMYVSTVNYIKMGKRGLYHIGFVIEPHLDMDVFHLTRQAIQDEMSENFGIKDIEIQFTKMLEKNIQKQR